MSSPLTSYPRTHGGGGSLLVQFQSLLAQVRGASGGATDMLATDLLNTLEALSAMLLDKPHADAQDHAGLAHLAVQARDALFIARHRMASITVSLHGKAMEICAVHWKICHPTVASTSLRAREVLATAMQDTATQVGNVIAIRMAKEEAGTISWLYQASALAGQDLMATVALHASAINSTRYIEKRSGGVLHYLESGASYNINQFIVIPVVGSADGMVLAGEAKGGASGYGQVEGPKLLMASFNRSKVSQRDPLYALTRAFYMKKAPGNTAVSSARRDAGMSIQRAYNSGSMLYLTARGDFNGGHINGDREIFKCQ
jgi:hypothetical protein